MGLKMQKLIIATTIIGLFVLTEYARAQPQITSNKAAFHLNESVMACGPVVEVQELARRTVLNFDRPFPEQSLSILIWDDKKNIFENHFGKLTSLLGKELCANGLVQEYHGNLQIKMKNPSLLRIVK